MYKKVTVILKNDIKLYSSYKFEEKSVRLIKKGNEITLEETGKYHTNGAKIFRLRETNRSYYTFEGFI